MATSATYPLRVDAELEPALSRWLWLVKWFLAIPHFIVLWFLWIAYFVLTFVSFFAILFTGRYPRSIFAFNVGVLRWSWRVADYAFGVLGTDRYPPFTLAEVPDYPANVDVAYPDHLSHWLPLVKWFLAIPHLVIVAILGGGGTWLAWTAEQGRWAVGGNLIGFLVIVAAVILMFTGTYPRPMFDLIIGLNRWVLRVAAYVGLMTDAYPPFRLDMGGTDPGGSTLTIPRPPAGGVPEGGAPPVPAPPERPDTAPRATGWTGGRITAVVIGSVLAVTSLGLFAGGGFLAWAAATQRDDQGYYTTSTQRFTTGTYALTATANEPGFGWAVSRAAAGTIRIRVTPTDPARSMFLGIGRSDDVAGYLAGVARAGVTRFDRPSYVTAGSGAPDAAPTDEPFWIVSSVGTGTRTVTWEATGGSWTVVVMDADAARGLDVRADAGATIPAVPWFAFGVLAAGVVLMVGAILLIALPIARATTSTSGG